MIYRVRRMSVRYVLLFLLAVVLVALALLSRSEVGSMTSQMAIKPQPPSMVIKPQPSSIPKPEGRLVDMPVQNKDSDMCKEWTGEASEATEWWHWACLLNRYFATVDYTCKRPVMAGNWGMCMDAPWNPPSPCLVYSVGIANQWSFDDYMSKKMNCTVHSFDPSMGKASFMRSPRNLFYNLGLGWEDNAKFNPRRDTYVRKEQLWTMMTLESIRSYLGHQNQVLDFLKVDIELSEWPFLEYLLARPQLLDQVRQFAIEWHIFPKLPKASEFEKMYRNLLRLRDLGFYAFVNHPYKWINVKNTAIFNSQSEISYVNMKFLNRGN